MNSLCLIVFLVIHVDSEDSSGCPEAHPVRLPNLSASQIVNALSEWDGMEDTISIFKNLQISESSK